MSENMSDRDVVGPERRFHSSHEPNGCIDYPATAAKMTMMRRMIGSVADMSATGRKLEPPGLASRFHRLPANIGVFAGQVVVFVAQA